MSEWSEDRIGKARRMLLDFEMMADPLVDAIRDRMCKIKVGPGMDQGNEMGPLITAEHRDRVAGYVADASSEGASVALDGRQDPASRGDGFFLGASLLDHVGTGMRWPEVITAFLLLAA